MGGPISSSFVFYSEVAQTKYDYEIDTFNFKILYTRVEEKHKQVCLRLLEKTNENFVL